LRGFPEPLWREDEDMIEVTIEVEIERQEVGVSMSREGLSLGIPSGQLWTIWVPSTGHASHESAMQKLGLWQRATAHGQRRAAAALRRQNQEHRRDARWTRPNGRNRSTHAERIAASPVEDTSRTRRLTPSMAPPPRRIPLEAVNQVGGVGRHGLGAILLELLRDPPLSFGQRERFESLRDGGASPIAIDRRILGRHQRDLLPARPALLSFTVRP
jgi:hypothetical protein